MAAQVSACFESIHGFFRPVLKKFEINNVCGVFDLRIGSMIVAIIFIACGVVGFVPFLGLGLITGIIFAVAGVMILISIFLNLRFFMIPPLIVSFVYIFVTLILIISMFISSFNLIHLIVKGVFWALDFFCFMIIYSYNVKMDDLPA